MQIYSENYIDSPILYFDLTPQIARLFRSKMKNLKFINSNLNLKSIISK